MCRRKICSLFLDMLCMLTIAAGLLAVYWGLQAEPVIIQEPVGATQCVQDFLGAVNGGRLADAAACFSDSSVLGTAPEDADPIAALIWDTYRLRLKATAVSALYTTADGLAMDVELTVPMVGSTVATIGVAASEAMQARVTAAEDMAELYDEDGQYRSELVDEVLWDAALQTLMEDMPTTTSIITISVGCSDGRWSIIADQTLINLLSGST